MSRSILFLAALCVLSGPSVSRAAVINGGFETGSVAGWTPIGASHTADATFGVTPTAGTYQGILESTGNFTALAPAVVASLDVPGAAILALGAGTPVNGSGLSQDVTVAAGDTLTFDWNFATDELDETATFNDFCFFTVDGAAYLLASRNSSTFNTTSPPAGFDGQTGWFTYGHTFTTAGTFKIGFGVFNVGDAGHNSVLLLDQVSLPVPEPTTLALLIAALPAGWLICTRRQKGAGGGRLARPEKC
jgi:hypothetical protein